MKANELRKKYLDFFKSKGHTVIPSASLVPANDPTVLFTTAGMHPLVPYLLGAKHPGGSRVVNVQKCVRTGDIDEVGDDTHLTFFEMLGNWSFGDYFKKEAIEWSWEFLTDKDWLGIDPKYLAISCFEGDKKMEVEKDNEAARIWKALGVTDKRIVFLGKDDNWWGPAGQTGPCGPDTEMFYWSEHSVEPPEEFDPRDNRWVEIWNDVFMEYNKTGSGRYEPLKQKNVDTGMGLDRVIAVLSGQKSVYDTDLFKPMFDVLTLSQDIMTNDEVKKARVVLDHVRAAVFMVADGIEPSNKDRGYILRRLLRRAMVNAKLLNLKNNWMKALVGQVITIYDSAYPELVEQSKKIFEVLEDEELKFGKTLEKGMREFEKSVSPSPSPSPSQPPSTMQRVLTGKDAFDLYQSHGFPLEVTRELAEQSGFAVDKEAFENEFRKHQELSRTASAGRFKGGLADHTEEVVRLHTATHLMNAALRQVLGDHVWQKGSNITKERTRFDFTHPKKMSADERKKVEDLVNQWIKKDYKVKKEIMTIEKAKELKAIGVFGEKYAGKVSIYTVYDPKTDEVISREFCGGPHVEHTGIIGNFKITKEEASSSGVRRIKAVVR
ncbi:MAG: alanine--tRNA ligase [Candidatus Doudnabacteria bacterium RIFCSPHIGHO2_01_FULL_43_23]|uniref:Alanine--tRNA ligase n=1 Tax=Candidatus Doudnabacteria bacterium RIFCSPHIGHO2_01_FULL_43_23 TaxID=1817822 RepID=A0A1F5NRN5_9BACT|nr:MAG: alanine--tRNA ligase [Candidatus Doudnabacteria bacterium RIFCSPHIGHO2_01_FULL_43_23]